MTKERQAQMSDTITDAEKFEEPIKILLEGVLADIDKVTEAVELLNSKQYFHLLFQILLQAVYPKNPVEVTYLSNSGDPGQLVRGLEAALTRASTFPKELLVVRDTRE